MRKLNIINLTGHAINILGWPHNNILISIPPSGYVARCKQVTHQEETVMGIVGDGEETWTGPLDLTCTEYTKNDNLPEPKPFTIYIVSELVASAYKGLRDDLYIINGKVKDKNHKILGCRTLGRLPV